MSCTRCNLISQIQSDNRICEINWVLWIRCTRECVLLQPACYTKVSIWVISESRKEVNGIEVFRYRMYICWQPQLTNYLHHRSSKYLINICICYYCGNFVCFRVLLFAQVHTLHTFSVKNLKKFLVILKQSLYIRKILGQCFLPRLTKLSQSRTKYTWNSYWTY